MIETILGGLTFVLMVRHLGGSSSGPGVTVDVEVDADVDVNTDMTRNAFILKNTNRWADDIFFSIALLSVPIKEK